MGHLGCSKLPVWFKRSNMLLPWAETKGDISDFKHFWHHRSVILPQCLSTGPNTICFSVKIETSFGLPWPHLAAPKVPTWFRLGCTGCPKCFPRRPESLIWCLRGPTRGSMQAHQVLSLLALTTRVAHLVPSRASGCSAWSLGSYPGTELVPHGLSDSSF